MPDQPRLRQISCSARAMRPALADTYIKSAMREKESSLGLLTNAWGVVSRRVGEGEWVEGGGVQDMLRRTHLEDSGDYK